MTRLGMLALVLFAIGCREEPTIVIKFEPNDMTGTTVAAKTDLATAPAPADLAVAETKKKSHAHECKAAADCVVEPLECCDCANGGKQHAIAKKAAAAAKSAHAAKCKTAMCTMMLSTDPSCGMRADCVDGACVMVAKKK
ncbi:MAG TPA: hypothetical protein VGL86_00030 [Polyangia bacterium]|jgi:uncharacterized lipoprotein NlpE involved in copper resistance